MTQVSVKEKGDNILEKPKDDFGKWKNNGEDNFKRVGLLKKKEGHVVYEEWRSTRKC